MVTDSKGIRSEAGGKTGEWGTAINLVEALGYWNSILSGIKNLLYTHTIMCTGGF